METIVVVAQHRNQYYINSSAHGPVRFGSFGSSPSRDFGEINCRAFQSGAGIAPTPLESLSKPVNKHASSSPLSSPKTPSPSVNSHSEADNRHMKSSAISIPFKINLHSNKEGSFGGDFPYSELWAGPAYSNSPPPSSLPIPQFSFGQKRTISLDLPSSASKIDLPSSASKIDLPPMTKSVSPSPKKEHNSSVRDLFFGDCADSATKTLRRILNLDITE